MPLFIIENHCNPIFLLEGGHDVKSRRSRLRSCHPNELGKPRCRPIRRHRDGLAITGSRRGTLHPSRQTALTAYMPKSAYCFPMGSRVAVHCETHAVDIPTSLYYDRQGCSPRRGIYGLATRRFRYRLYNTSTRK